MFVGGSGSGSCPLDAVDVDEAAGLGRGRYTEGGGRY